MHLGRLELPRDLWPQLAAELTEASLDKLGLNRLYLIKMK
jgi:hypothetical protein